MSVSANRQKDLIREFLGATDDVETLVAALVGALAFLIIQTESDEAGMRRLVEDVHTDLKGSVMGWMARDKR